MLPVLAVWLVRATYNVINRGKGKRNEQDYEVDSISYYGSAIITVGLSVSEPQEDYTIYHRSSRAITHKRPDSLERIADEISGAKENCVGNALLSSIAQDKLDDWADRIRKLANGGAE